MKNWLPLLKGFVLMIILAVKPWVLYIMQNITTGAIECRTKFHVVDIKAFFNLLLGRPWLHELKAILSSLHQKVKAIVGGVPITIDASPVRIQVIDTPIVHVKHDKEDEDL